MNPLSPITYYLRHKRSSMLLVFIITLATTGLYVMVAVLDSIPMRAHVNYLTKVSRVYPSTNNTLEPGIVSQIQTHPDVARVIWDNGVKISPPTLIGVDNFRVMGVSQDDLGFLVAHYGVRLKEGRMFEPYTNEIVLSEEVVRASELRIGDQIDSSISERYYGSIPNPLKLVGILEGDPMLTQGPSARVGFASYEYFDSHEAYAHRAPNLLIVAQEGRKESMDEFLETTIASERIETETFREVSQLVSMALRGIHVISGIVNCLVALVVALVIGVINRIAMMERLPEFGLLYALGFHKKRLISRLSLETAAVAGIGWVVGLGLSIIILLWLKSSLYYAKGMELNLSNFTPMWFTLPVPVVIVTFASHSARRVFARLDAIAVIEKGKLSTETEYPKRMAKRSSFKPLSLKTFYNRHRRRGVLLVMSMALMILGVAFPVFLVLPMGRMMTDIEYLRYASMVSPGMGNAVDPGVMAQVRTHPAVADVIQVMPFGIQAYVPPGGETQISILGVSEEQLQVLIEQFGVTLVKGRLPRARTNEMVISDDIARNRGLRLGETVGRPVQARNGQIASSIKDDLPIEMVVVGLLSSEDLWIGFASLEYVQSHEISTSRPTSLLVIPSKDVKGEMDSWLEGSIASTLTQVTTYDEQRRYYQQTIHGLLMMFAGVESIIAFVAAIALAVLNYIFFAQRRDEFGTLQALGRGRLWLVLRTVKETGSVIGFAWLIGAAVCLAVLVIAQITIYTPIGMTLNLLDPVPWLFTLPIPLAVVIVGTGTISRTLSKLDPVTIIERNS